MNVRLCFRFQSRDRGGCGRSLRTLLLEILAGDEPASPACRYELFGSLLALQLGCGVRDALLQRSELKVILGHLRRDADLEIAPIPDRALGPCACGLHASLRVAEQIDFPACIEPDAEGAELGAREAETHALVRVRSGRDRNRILADAMAREDRK